MNISFKNFSFRSEIYINFHNISINYDKIKEIHKYIRNLLSERYGNKISDNTSIIYGGSVKPNSARDIFEKQDVDGGLIGGASLSPQDFIDIVRSI